MEWHYLENQFNNATRGSFRLMLTVTNDHYAKLVAQQADADILALLNRTEPVHQAFLNAYSNWKTQQALYKSATQTMKNLRDELAGKHARQWDAAIMVQYDKGTAEHTALLPNGRSPFQSGTYDQRISAVKTLGETLDDYAPLAALKTTVDGFYTTIKNARDAQQGKENTSAQASTDLEVARIDIATMLYRNFGALIDKFGETPDNVSNYFEVSLLQSKSNAAPPTEEEYTGEVPANSTVNIFQGASETATIIITNTGTVPLYFCEANADDGTCGIDDLELAPGDLFEGKASDFNDPENAFFNVTNTDPATAGGYNVEVVTPAS